MLDILMAHSVIGQEKAVILARREYQRKWRENNKDKVKAHNERFFKKQAEKLAKK